MTLLLIFVGTMAIALLAQWQVKRMYLRYSRVPAMSGYTGAEAAHQILRHAGIRDVEIVEHNEMLGDHYDPTSALSFPPTITTAPRWRP